MKGERTGHLVRSLVKSHRSFHISVLIIIMDFKQLIAARRSRRVFGKNELSPNDVQMLLRAALMAPTSRNNRGWQFIVVDDKNDLDKLADTKEHGAAFIRQAAMAVVIAGDPTANDCWVEDGSIAAFAMQLQAEELGLASCWVQIRGRRISDATPSADIVRGILDIPQQLDVLCIIAFGEKVSQAEPHDEEQLLWEHVHIGKYQNTL